MVDPVGATTRQSCGEPKPLSTSRVSGTAVPAGDFGTGDGPRREGDEPSARQGAERVLGRVEAEEEFSFAGFIFEAARVRTGLSLQREQVVLRRLPGRRRPGRHPGVDAAG